ncbi:uncharacterized protein HKW66_Vig0148880 [Vigna angularis]|uniref:Uncharacterized protein n=1 Tax=Phaseolus angularis TaxID=3914 RepID=A0A8T0JUN8_PHAAN|nr:uncharacterized protein HKW66_Vig0148880 [Vigna angularis]
MGSQRQEPPHQRSASPPLPTDSLRPKPRATWSTLIPIKENQRTKGTLKSKHPSDHASEPDSDPDYRPHRLGSKTAHNRFALPTCSLKPLAPPPQPLQAPSCEAVKRDIDFWKSWPFGFDHGRRRWSGKGPTGARESTTSGGTTAGAGAALLGSTTGSSSTGKVVVCAMVKGCLKNEGKKRKSFGRHQQRRVHPFHATTVVHHAAPKSRCKAATTTRNLPPMDYHPWPSILETYKEANPKNAQYSDPNSEASSRILYLSASTRWNMSSSRHHKVAALIFSTT